MLAGRESGGGAWANNLVGGGEEIFGSLTGGPGQVRCDEGSGTQNHDAPNWVQWSEKN